MAWQSVYVSRCRSLHGTLLPTLAVGTFQSAVDNPVVGTFQLAVDRPLPIALWPEMGDGTRTQDSQTIPCI